MSKKEMKITDEQLEKIRAQVNVRGKLISDIGAVEAQKHDLLHALNNVMQKKNEQHLNELDEKAAELQIAKIIARLMMQDPELKQIPADKITATAKEIGQMSAEELGDLSAQTPSGDDKAAIVSQDLQREASVAGGGGVPGYGAPAFKTRRKKHEQR